MCLSRVAGVTRVTCLDKAKKKSAAIGRLRSVGSLRPAIHGGLGGMEMTGHRVNDANAR
jgi:hypothetical protein